MCFFSLEYAAQRKAGRAGRGNSPPSTSHNLFRKAGEPHLNLSAHTALVKQIYAFVS